MRAASCLCAALLCPAFAQIPPPSLSFEVASVKLHPAGGSEANASSQTGGPGTSDPGQITVVNRTLHRLLIDSFVIKGYQLQAPESLDSARYDIVAKVPTGATKHDAHVMMQNLLIERLKLKLHHEPRVLPVYALVVAKSGTKLVASSESPVSSAASGIVPSSAGKPKIDKDGFPIEQIDPVKGGIVMSAGNGGAIKVTAVKQTMAQLISMLAGETDRAIVDMTGLSGKYDFSMTFGGQWRRANADGSSDLTAGVFEGDGPPIFEAIEKQLGLKLESRKISVDMLIVDSGAKTPVEN